MSKSFHINSRGEPGQCKAEKGHCPFGSTDDHYKSENEARIAYEQEMGSSFETVADPIKGMFKAATLARETTDPDVLMQIARGGNKRALRELAKNEATDAEVLAEASTKVDEDSNERKMLEAHANFPAYALSARGWEKRFEDQPYYRPTDITVDNANDVALVAMAKKAGWSQDAMGQKVVAILENPSTSISDEAIEEAAKQSEMYAQAAGRGGRFPTSNILDNHFDIKSAGTILYSLKHIRDEEKIREVWAKMEGGDWSSATAQDLLSNPNTPQDLRQKLSSEVQSFARWRASGGGRSRGSSSSPYSSGSSSSSDSISPLSPLSPYNPTNYS